MRPIALWTGDSQDGGRRAGEGQKQRQSGEVQQPTTRLPEEQEHVVDKDGFVRLTRADGGVSLVLATSLAPKLPPAGTSLPSHRITSGGLGGSVRWVDGDGSANRSAGGAGTGGAALLSGSDSARCLPANLQPLALSRKLGCCPRFPDERHRCVFLWLAPVVQSVHCLGHRHAEVVLC